MAITVVLRLPALLADRHLTFDDGVFGASAVAMREGGVPFRDVFSSQGPLFLPLVYLADLVGLRTLDAPRLLGLASGVGLVLAAWAIARRLGTERGARRAGLLAGLLVATSGSILFVTGPVAADGPALALAALAVAAVLRYRDEPSLGLALLVGALTGAALVVKALVLPVVVPVGLVLLAARRLDRFAAAVGAAVAVALVPTLAFGAADVWDQAVTYHTEAADQRTPLANLGKIASTFASRDTLVLAVAAVAAGFALARRAWTVLGRWRLPDGRLAGGFVLATWLATTVVVLAAQHPLWRPHVAHLVVPVALLAVLARPPLKAVVVAVVAASPWWFASTLPILVPEDYGPVDQEIVAELAELPEGALAISDEPGLVWRAGRHTPPDWVDGSILLVESGRLTEDDVVEEAGEPEVCAVLVRSDRWGGFAGLPERLDELGYQVGVPIDADRALYVQGDCRPG